MWKLLLASVGSSPQAHPPLRRGWGVTALTKGKWENALQLLQPRDPGSGLPAATYVDPSLNFQALTRVTSLDLQTAALRLALPPFNVRSSAHPLQETLCPSRDTEMLAVLPSQGERRVCKEQVQSDPEGAQPGEEVRL